MRWRTTAIMAIVGVLTVASPAAARRPPVFGDSNASEGRVACVDLGIGPLARTRCDIPTGSRFAQSGEAAECEYPGVPAPAGTLHYRETEPIIVPRLPIPDMDWLDVKATNDFFLLHMNDYGGEVRFFWVECIHPDGAHKSVIQQDPIVVRITDPLLDIRPWVESQARRLPLPVPELTTLPEPGPLGWLKVNNPAWLAVTPASWRPVTTPPQPVNGWDVSLTVRPTVLAFTVDQGEQRVSVPCDVYDQRYVAGTLRFPAEPEGFTDEPNWFDPPEHPFAARDCVWTPRVKGDGAVTIAITYNVTAIAAGRVFEFAPRTQTATAPIEVVELRIVNVKS